MIYILKLVVCSASFLLVYLFLLQREKMFGFNRIFLLSGLVLPFFIPLLTFQLNLSSEAALIPPAEEWVPALPAQTESVAHSGQIPAEAPDNYLLLTYLVITAVLFLRFAVNLQSIWRNIRSHEHILLPDHTLVLLDQPVSPHSFMGYIFVNRKDWQENRIEKEILHHECLHGKLYHSADILLIEFLQVFSWFNPVLYFYKRAIGLNHEYQVDEQVLKHFNDPRKYQLLLLNQAIMPARRFSHSFNYIHLKKRIRMISAKPDSVMIQLKIAFAVIFTGGSAFLFAGKTFARQNSGETALPMQQRPSVTDISGSEEFDQLASKALTHSVKGKEYRFTAAETNRMGDLYAQMTEEEKMKQKLTLTPKKHNPSKGNPPSREQFESFKDPKIYGVWLDGKRVPNHILNKYQHTDFADFSQSILLKSAVHYGQYKYHLDLSTVFAFQAYANEVKKDTSRYMIWYKQDFYRQTREKIAPSKQPTAPEKTKSKQPADERTGMSADAPAPALSNAENPDQSGNLNKSPLTSPEGQFRFSDETTYRFIKFGFPVLPKYAPPLSLYRFRIGHPLFSYPDSLQKKSP